VLLIDQAVAKFLLGNNNLILLLENGEGKHPGFFSKCS